MSETMEIEDGLVYREDFHAPAGGVATQYSLICKIRRRDSGPDNLEGRGLKIEIKADFYASQCYAHVFVWDVFMWKELDRMMPENVAAILPPVGGREQPIEAYQQVARELIATARFVLFDELGRVARSG